MIYNHLSEIDLFLSEVQCNLFFIIAIVENI